MSGRGYMSGDMSGHLSGGHESGDTVARTLLAVVGPPAAAGDAAADAARVALAAEANRLAAALDALVGFATWSATEEIDFAGLAAAVAGVARSAGTRLAAVLIQDGDVGRQLAPLVARLLGSNAVLGATDARVTAESRLVFVKPVYGGWLEQEIIATEGFVPVVTLDLSGIEPGDAAAAQAAAALTDASPLPAAPATGASAAAGSGAVPRVRHLATIPPDARAVDLVHAKRIVAAGMGAVDEKLMAAVRELAELLEGSVGATRPVVDEGRLPKERLIGQTGRTVAPDLYVALGVSGSPHHVAGVRKADRVLSINRDVRAPIFQFSDVGYVADLEAVLPALIERIKSWRDAPEAGEAASGDPGLGPARGPGSAPALPPGGES